jgi:hypothetical protein
MTEENKYRLGYTIFRHYTSEYNYPTSEIVSNGYVKGKSIDDVKQKAVEFTVSQNLGIFGTLKTLENNLGMIDNYTLQKFKNDNLDIEDRLTIEFDDTIEEIPKKILFDFDKMIKESKEYEDAVIALEELVKKVLAQRKKDEKERLEARLKELEGGE